jgi:hypothetical protein
VAFYRWRPCGCVPFRLHFSDAAMVQMEQLGADADAVRTAIDAGVKPTLGENHLLCRHRGLEVEVVIEGPDYHIIAVRRQAEWPRRAPRLAYLQKIGKA